jgi:hypothetical protein
MKLNLTPSKQMLPGEWFYVQYYVDGSGNGSVFGFDADVVNGPKHIEDTGNVAAWANGTNSTATYWYVGALSPASIRWDNTIVESNSQNALDPPSNGSTKWTTAGGTKLNQLNDPNGTPDGHVPGAIGEIFNLSNIQGVWKDATLNFSNFTGFYPNPCGEKATSPNACNPGGRDGFANIDLNFVRIPFRMKTTATAGKGSFIEPAMDSNTIVIAYKTDGAPWSPGAHTAAAVPRSNNWPNWCVVLPNSGCFAGGYNWERSYVCVQ